MAITNGIYSALSGVNAAARRFDNSASNVANVESVAAPNGSTATTDADGNPLFRTQRSIDSTTTTGGVRSTQQLADPVSVQRYDPDAPDADGEGLVNRPNVALEREVVDQISAQKQFEANLATIRTADELFESTLDILS
ncbi:MAG: flagellar basal body rod C-terminal domain-containing protein [Thalassobaculaceae bacterium]|nr:flagellar basal body rod C-terminal domain-containing protein [Thalassobaculaceae bacterium]